MLRRLIINWQDEGSRRLIPVAELVATGAPPSVRFEFGYLEAVTEARKLGFQPFAAFPEIDRRYVSAQLFPFFANRVMPTTRPDYLEYVSALGLTPETANVVDLLGRSEGRRQTDQIETALAAERDAVTGRYVAHFLVRAVRHVPNAESVVAKLRPGSDVQLVLEATNAIDPRARLVRFEGEPFGYVPAYLLADLDALEAAGAGPRVSVVRVNPSPAPAHHRVLARLDADWPEGFQPFSGPGFMPVARATDVALERAS